MASVAVIDVGSNSIKVLVAEHDAQRGVCATLTKTLDARISAGISRAQPSLTEASMARGLAAIHELLAAVAPFAPSRIILVATSAVRDAINGADFRHRVRQATGHEIRILSGNEEATLIGRGLMCDPTLPVLRDFFVFDLGGGSLEALTFRDRIVEQALSLPLGCVRLTERFHPVPADPLTPASVAAIYAHVVAALQPPAFRWTLPASATAIATGGTVTTARAIWAARAGKQLDETEPTIQVSALHALATELGELPLAERQRIPGLPAARADVFPTALVTLVALAAAGGLERFRHSFYNLRFGLAAEALDGG